MAATGYAGGDPTKVAKAGDTMTGALVLPGDPTAALQAADKQYVDTAIAGASGAVVTVNGRSGAVVLTAADVAPVAESQVTGLTTDLAAKMPLSLAVAKGDLFVATSSATLVRLPVGADGTALVADSTQPSGVRWSAPSAGFTPIRITSGPTLGNIFGGGAGGSQPTGIPPSVWILTLPAAKVAVGHLLNWSMPLISTGSDAQCDLASLVSGSPMNFYSDGYGPTQAANGHSGLYVSGDYGADQGPSVWWVVQPTDLAGDGSFTISFLFQPSGSHQWGHAAIPGQVDLVNVGPHS